MASVQPLTRRRPFYSLSIYTTTRPAKLSKTIRLSDDGNVVKEAGGAMSYGNVETFEAHTPEHFLTLLKMLNPSQALGFGILKGGRKEAAICPKEKLAPDAIPRTKDFFEWPAGPGILMLDYDPPPGGAALTKHELLAALYRIAPALKTVPHVWSASAGSCIRNTITGEDVVGIRGQRIYVFASDATQIPAAMMNLYERSILNGFGWPYFTAHGKVSPRALFDISTGQPNRYDFAGGAECIAPLIQVRPDPDLFAGDKDWGNLLEVFPPVTDEEKAKIEYTIQHMCSAPDVLETQKQKREQFIKAKGLDEVSYKKIYEKDTLPLDMMVRFFDGETATVKDILRCHPRYHKKECYDPVEPDYRNMDGKIAICYSDTHGMPPRIYSQAHGGKNYYFETYDSVEQMIDTYAVVNTSGTTHIVEITPGGIHTCDVAELKKLWANRPATRVVGEKIIKLDPVKLFLESPRRKDYCGWVFCPAGREPANHLNEWRGPYIKPAPGVWSKFEYLCRTVLCRDNELYYEYLMDWIAEACLNIGANKPGIALVLYGEEGTGKNQFFEYFRPILGPFSMLIDDHRRIFSDFNMHLRNQQLVFLDESIVPNDKKNRSHLKGLITNQERAYNQKNRPMLTLPDPSRYILSTNDQHVVAASWDARRFFVLNVSSAMRRNYAFFKSLNEERDTGGMEALYHHLLSRQWNMTRLRTPPHTEFLTEQMELSSQPHEQWWQECLEFGYLVGIEFVPSYSDTYPEVMAMSRLDVNIADLPKDRQFEGRLAIPRELAFNSYLGWMRRQNERRLLNNVHFSRFIGKVARANKDDEIVMKLVEGPKGLRLPSGQDSGALKNPYMLFPPYETLLNCWKSYTSRV